jgi:hypothetical protein
LDKCFSKLFFNGSLNLSRNNLKIILNLFKENKIKLENQEKKLFKFVLNFFDPKLTMDNFIKVLDINENLIKFIDLNIAESLFENIAYSSDISKELKLMTPLIKKLIDIGFDFDETNHEGYRAVDALPQEFIDMFDLIVKSIKEKDYLDKNIKIDDKIKLVKTKIKI